jgi:hypothetical protein
MNWFDLKGRIHRVNPSNYAVDWEKIISAPQKAVKDFLYPYWKNDLVLEEARIPSSLYRIDLVNVSKNIMIEVSPVSSHSKYNPFFHGSLAGYRAAIKRDLEKARWAALNGLKYIEIDDQPTQLTEEYFAKHYEVLL